MLYSCKVDPAVSTFMLHDGEKNHHKQLNCHFINCQCALIVNVRLDLEKNVCVCLKRRSFFSKIMNRVYSQCVF